MRFFEGSWCSRVLRSLALAVLVTACGSQSGAPPDAPVKAAAALPATDAFPVTLAGDWVDLGGFTMSGSLFTDGDLSLTVSARASWTAPLSTSVSYDPEHVRQGAALELERSSAPVPGTLSVQWQLTGSVAGVNATVNVPAVASCAPSFGAGTYTCSVHSPGVPLLYTPGLPASPYVDLGATASFTITAEGLVATRSLAIDGAPVLPDGVELEITGVATTETVVLPCDAPAGRSVTYALAPLRWTPAAVATQRADLRFGLMDPFIGAVKIEAGSKGFGPAEASSVGFDLASAGHTTELGELKANDVAPVVAAIPERTGLEGAPISFSAAVTSACPIGSWVWEFSDGTTSYGPAPERAFADDARYSGQLTVTDATGLSATRSFSVLVGNALPVPDAGPDTSGPWGTPIAFTGQAVDPGTADQDTLVYAWDWGDGTPGTGGARAKHVYANPGTYVATLRVCDVEGCAEDQATVVVTPRPTVLAYGAPAPAIHGQSTTLGASLVDLLGNPVPGAAIAFTVAGAPVGTAQTDAAGFARLTVPVTFSPGANAVAVSYAGSTRYAASATSGTLSVDRITSTILYTGTLESGPNKDASLSAVLADGLGRPLAGRVVTFVVGAQQITAITGPTGIAATMLTITQKNGTYPLSATWLPEGPDADLYTGSAASATFAIGLR